MKTYRQFISEQKQQRTAERAYRLVDRIHKKSKISYSDDIKNLLPKHQISATVGLNLNYKDFKERGTITDVPMHKLYSDQRAVNSEVLKKKIRGDWKHHDPEIPYVIHHVPTDTYHLYDGNHRANQTKLLRHAVLKASVIKCDL